MSGVLLGVELSNSHVQTLVHICDNDPAVNTITSFLPSRVLYCSLCMPRKRSEEVSAPWNNRDAESLGESQEAGQRVGGYTQLLSYDLLYHKKRRPGICKNPSIQSGLQYCPPPWRATRWDAAVECSLASTFLHCKCGSTRGSCWQIPKLSNSRFQGACLCGARHTMVFEGGQHRNNQADSDGRPGLVHVDALAASISRSRDIVHISNEPQLTHPTMRERRAGRFRYYCSLEDSRWSV